MNEQTEKPEDVLEQITDLTPEEIKTGFRYLMERQNQILAAMDSQNRVIEKIAEALRCHQVSIEAADFVKMHSRIASLEEFTVDQHRAMKTLGEVVMGHQKLIEELSPKVPAPKELLVTVN